MNDASQVAFSITAPENLRTFERVLQSVEDSIENGSLYPGQRLVSERELAATLKVSRPSVREALRALEMLGLLKTVDRQGAVVQTPSSSSFARFFRLMLSLQRSMTEELLELRIVLDCEAAALAAKRSTSQDLARIRDCLEEMAVEVKGGGTGAKADIGFHSAVHAATHNGSMGFIYEAIADLLKQSHHSVRAEMLRNRRTLEDLLQVHEEIYESIRDKDSDGAAAKMRRHFSFTAAIYEQLEKEHRLLGMQARSDFGSPD